MRLAISIAKGSQKPGFPTYPGIHLGCILFIGLVWLLISKWALPLLSSKL